MSTIFPPLRGISLGRLLRVAPLLILSSVLTGLAISTTKPFVEDLMTRSYSSIRTGLWFLLLIATSRCISVLSDWQLIQFCEALRLKFSRTAMKSYLEQDLGSRCDRSDGQATLLVEIDQWISQGLLSGLLILSRLAMSIGVLGFLFFDNVLLGITIAAILGVSCVVMQSVSSSLLRKVGQERVRLQAARLQAMRETELNLEQVQLSGKQEAFLGWYLDLTARFSKSLLQTDFFSKSTRYFVEALSLLIFLLVILLAGGGDVATLSIPAIATMACGAYRLLPLLMEMQYRLALLTASRPSWNALDRLMENCEEVVSLPSPAILQRRLTLRRLSFQFQEGPTLHFPTLELEGHRLTGITGPSGCGKTTLLHLIAGLYEPLEGEILSDGIIIPDTRAQMWRKRIGYVPGQWSVLSRSIAQNIAFELDPTRVDVAAVQRAARLSGMAEVIERLPEGYESAVGERGAKLSQGQLQRLLLARALYRRPSLLLLDEPTSAVEEATAIEILRNLRHLRNEMTIVLVSHDRQVLSYCDAVIDLSTNSSLQSLHRVEDRAQTYDL